MCSSGSVSCFFSNHTATTEIYTDSHTLSLHDALPSSRSVVMENPDRRAREKMVCWCRQWKGTSDMVKQKASVALAGVLLLLLLQGSAFAQPDMSALPPGYLARDQLPDSLALLPPPPEPGSAAFARDEEASRETTVPPESERWKPAASDADLHPPHIDRKS